jgi:hypothetical protein
MAGYGGCCCRAAAPQAAPLIPVAGPVAQTGGYGVGIIAIAILILIALGVIF